MANRNPQRLLLFAVANNAFFWLGTFFLYFERELALERALQLQGLYYLGGALLEVPAGFFSDRFGRRRTLLMAAGLQVLGGLGLFFGGWFALLACGQLMLAGSAALVSGSDTALLYESLRAAGREGELVEQEARLQRASLLALGASALVGGLVGVYYPGLPYALTAAAGLLALWAAAGLRDLPRDAARTTEMDLVGMRQAARDPMLLWCLGVAMTAMVINHVPLEFLQPILRSALLSFGIELHWTSALSGLLLAATMGLGALASLALPRLVRSIGPVAAALSALALQVGVVTLLSAALSPWLASLLLLRSVPQALLQPSLRALVHPRLPDHLRATWLSLQSLLGQLLFAGLLAGVGVWQGPRQSLQSVALSEVLAAFAVLALSAWTLLWLCRPRR